MCVGAHLAILRPIPCQIRYSFIKQSSVEVTGDQVTAVLVVVSNFRAINRRCMCLRHIQARTRYGSQRNSVSMRKQCEVTGDRAHDSQYVLYMFGGDVDPETRPAMLSAKTMPKDVRCKHCWSFKDNTDLPARYSLRIGGHVARHSRGLG
jgi:hypothetical protein